MIRTLLRGRRTLVAAAAAAALLVYTLAGFFLVPWIVDWQIRRQTADRLGRAASVNVVRFNPFTLALTLERLVLKDRDDVDLLTLERLHANVEVSGLFRRALRLSELTVEKPVLAARILASGQPSVADLMEADADATSEEPSTLPRLIIDRLALSGGVVDFHDASRTPAYHSRFEPIDLEITDLITLPQQSGEHTLAIGVGDGATLRWTGRQVVDPLSFSGTLEVSRVELPRVWEYFAASLPLELADGRADVTLPYQIARNDAGTFEMTLDGASAHITSLVMRPRGGDGDEEWLALPDLRAEGLALRWPARSLTVARIQAAGPRVAARMERDGLLNWQRALAEIPGEPADAAGSAPWDIRVAAVGIEGGVATFEDARLEPAPVVTIANLGFGAEDVRSDPGSPIAFRANGAFRSGDAEAGTLEASGTVIRAPFDARVAFALGGIDLVPVRGYVQAPGAQLASGRVSLNGTLAASSAPDAVELSADGALEGVELLDATGGRLVAWNRMSVRGLTYSGGPNRARIRNVVFDRPYARLHIDRTGTLNLTTLRSESPDPTSSPSSESPALEVEVVEFRDGSAEFTDESLLLPFRAEIHAANGSIRDLSTFAAAPATLALEGRVGETGYVKADGTLRTADPMAASEVTLSFRSIDMLGLTPYFAQFAGYAVKSGVLDLDVKYVINDRRLLGNHSLIARDLVLGNRVKDSRAPSLPIRLAVALLKDRDGRINLDVPIEGTVDSPEFNYNEVFWSAVRTILANAAKAPFRALGRLFGRDEDDLELVEFEPGRSDLLPAEQATLTRLAEELASRPELTLAIEGRFDEKVDVPAVKRAKLDALIESRRSAVASEDAAGTSVLERILESLYAEQFSPEALEAERMKFTAAAAAAPVAEAEAPAQAPAPAAAPGPAAPPAFDRAAFYESLRARLLDAQAVSGDDLQALGRARAQSIAAALTASGAVAADRITLSDPAAASRRRRGSDRIASEMSMSAGD